MRDNLYFQTTYRRLYGNIFVLIVGPPALGKSLPMQLGGALIKAANNTKVIEGSASIQAVVKSLGQYETGGKKGASCILYSEELSSFYIKDQSTNELLTDLWDYHEVWERNLISWSASLKNVCLSLFAASNEILLKGIFDDRALYGGLLSRTILVLEKRKRHKDSMIFKSTVVQDSDRNLLIEHVKNLSKLKGEISFAPDAAQEFDNWYTTQWCIHEDNPSTKTGIEGRMKTHVHKVSMLLAMGEPELNLHVRKEHVEYAIELCTGLYKNYQILSSEGGKASSAHASALLLKILHEAPSYELSRRIIIRRNLGEFPVDVLDATVLQLREADLLAEVNSSNEVSYRLTSKALEIYERAGKKH